MSALEEYRDPGNLYRIDDERVFVDKGVADAAIDELLEMVRLCNIRRADAEARVEKAETAWQNQCADNLALHAAIAELEADCVRLTEMFERAEALAVEEGVKRAKAEGMLRYVAARHTGYAYHDGTKLCIKLGSDENVRAWLTDLAARYEEAHT